MREERATPRDVIKEDNKKNKEMATTRASIERERERERKSKRTRVRKKSQRERERVKETAQN